MLHIIQLSKCCHLDDLNRFLPLSCPHSCFQCLQGLASLNVMIDSSIQLIGGYQVISPLLLQVYNLCRESKL